MSPDHHSRHVVRPPAVAGTFYPAGEAELRRELDACFLDAPGPGALPDPTAPWPLAIVSPHAGIAYSGPFAAHAYSALGRPRVAVIVGPSHRGPEARLALSSADAWRTPLGEAVLDGVVAALLREACPSLAVDDRAHALEHSLELQLVFLQRAVGADLRIVPIALATHDLEVLRQLGKGLAEAARLGALVVASTDLSHYLPEPVARATDLPLIARIEALDVDGLLDLLSSGRAQACGAGGVIAAMLAALELGARNARCLAYGTSAETGGPRDAVVGYAALRIERPAAT